MCYYGLIMRKVLFVVNDLGVGGVQRLTVDFANMLDRSRFEVMIATLFDRGDRSFFFRDQLKKDVRLASFNFKNLLSLGEWLKFYRFLRAERFNIVFTQMFFADTIGRFTARIARVPAIIMEEQNIIPNFPKRYILINKLLRFATDACISTTPAVTEYAMRRHGFRREEIIEIPTNCVDTGKFDLPKDRAAFRRALGLPESALIIANVGRMIEQKGQEFLIRAAAIIAKERDDAYFVIVGDGELRAKLETLAKELGVAERIFFLGVRKDVPNILVHSDLFVFPSVYEGQGLILFDVFYAKLPVVASNTGGIPDVVRDGETGLLAEPGNAADLATKILRLIGDQDLARHLADRAFLEFGGRTLESATRLLEKVFDGAING